MKSLKTNLLFLSAISILFFIEAIGLKDYPFFWDSVSKSSRATWFFNHNFEQWVLPTSYNSGHPPLWPLLMAGFWTIFGKTLLVSRLFMFLFNVFTFYQGYLFLKKFVKGIVFPLFLFLFLIEPTFITQTTVMNNDILLLGLIFMALNAILNNHKYLQTIALTGILLTNLRGMGAFAALLLTDLLIRKKSIKQIAQIYLLSSLPFLGYLGYQYHHIGWVIFTPSKHWASQRETLRLYKMLRNVLVIGFNLFIYGQFLIFIIGTALVLKYKNCIKDKKTQFLLLSFLSFLIVFSILFIPFSNPIGVRYYMVNYWLGLALIARILYLKRTYIKPLFILLTLGFASTPLWIFPREISQPWDSTPAYFNYFSVEKKMLLYIEQNHIPIPQIGTNIPLNKREYQYLSFPFKQKFPALNTHKNPYILYSNIENETKEKSLQEIRHNYKIVKKYNQNGVYIELWKKQ